MGRKHGGAQRERESRVLLGGLNHLCGGSSSGFPLASHLAVSGSESIFGLSQPLPPQWACAFLAKLDSCAKVSGKLTEHLMV